MLNNYKPFNFGKFLSFLAGEELPTISLGDIQFKGDVSFTSHYNQYILPKIQKFEEQRLSALKTFRTRCFILPPVLIFIISLTALVYYLVDFLGLKNKVEFCFMGGGLLAGLAICWTYAPVSKYKLAIKSEIFPLIFQYFGNNITYSAESNFPIKSASEFGILPDFDQSFLEDSVSGTYKDVKLDFTQARLEVIKNMRRSSTQNPVFSTPTIAITGFSKPKLKVSNSTNSDDVMFVPVFKGLVIQLSMNKLFIGKTIVKKDAGVIGNFFERNAENLERVKLEDPTFERVFEVYATDQIEARYLLNPSFMERLVQLTKLFNNSPLQSSFFKNSLLITISSDIEYFKPASIFTPATFEDDINTILAQMNLIFQIIDILKLNDKNNL